MTKLLSYVLFLMVASSTIAIAQSTLEARVVNVLSGDLLIVSIDHEAELVHLYGVDCPKRNQAGWLKACNFTKQMVLYKQIVLEPVGAKRAEAGTIQARVYVGELCINDALADMVLALKELQDPS